jgi:hypothetical protein
LRLGNTLMPFICTLKGVHLNRALQNLKIKREHICLRFTDKKACATSGVMLIEEPEIPPNLYRRGNSDDVVHDLAGNEQNFLHFCLLRRGNRPS